MVGVCVLSTGGRKPGQGAEGRGPFPEVLPEPQAGPARRPHPGSSPDLVTENDLVPAMVQWAARSCCRLVRPGGQAPPSPLSTAQETGLGRSDFLSFSYQLFTADPAPRQPFSPQPSLELLAALRTRGSPWLSAPAQAEAHVTLPGACSPGVRAVVMASRAHPSPRPCHSALPACPRSGPQGPPTAPRGVCWLVTEECSSRVEQQSLVLAPRSPSRSPPSVLSQRRSLAEGRCTLDAHWVVTHLPGSPACLNAICAFCPAGQQTRALG